MNARRRVSVASRLRFLLEPSARGGELFWRQPVQLVGDLIDARHDPNLVTGRRRLEWVPERDNADGQRKSVNYGWWLIARIVMRGLPEAFLFRKVQFAIGNR